MSRRGRLLPGRRQALLLAVLILVAGGSLLLLPDRSRSYRAVATAVVPSDAPACVQRAPELVGTDPVQDTAASQSRVPRRDVEEAMEVLTAPPGALLAVAFRADTGYAAQRGAFTIVAESVTGACSEEAADLLISSARAAERLADAQAALRAAVPPTEPPAPPLPPPPLLVVARDEAEARLAEATEAFERQQERAARSTSVDAAEPLGSERSRLGNLAVPAGTALCAALAFAILWTGWRRAGGPVPA